MRVTRNFMSSMLFGTGRSTRRSRMTNQSQTSSRNRLFNTRAINQASSTQTNYMNMKNNAGELQSISMKLMDTGENSLFANAKKSGNTTEVTKQIKEFVTYYNGMVKNMRSGGSRVDSSYLNQLNAYTTMYRSALKETGVTKQADGTLAVDEKALNGASLEQLQKAFGSGSSFAAKTGVTAVYVQSNAVTNLNNLVSNSYSNLLRNYGTSGNFFNFFM